MVRAEWCIFGYRAFGVSILSKHLFHRKKRVCLRQTLLSIRVEPEYSPAIHRPLCQPLATPGFDDVYDFLHTGVLFERTSSPLEGKAAISKSRLIAFLLVSFLERLEVALD